jgi:hypothetical protein
MWVFEEWGWADEQLFECDGKSLQMRGSIASPNKASPRDVIFYDGNICVSTEVPWSLSMAISS